MSLKDISRACGGAVSPAQISSFVNMVGHPMAPCVMHELEKGMENLKLWPPSKREMAGLPKE
jgi:hypothetical protein